MKRKALLFGLILAGLLMTAGPRPAAASETDALLNKLVEKGILTSEEAQEVRNDMAKDSGAAAKMREEDTKETAKKMAGGSWLDKVKWSGDLRLRHETQLREPATDRQRERFRLRFGFTAKPWDPLEIGVRLATGASGDPLSTNQSFGATFDKKAIFIDKAYAKYTPWRWLSLTGGKMDIPYEYTELVWDADVTPEGGAVQMKSPAPIPGLKDFLPVTPFLNLGAFPIAELAADEGDPALFGFQTGANVDLPNGWVFQPSIAYYDFTAIKGTKASLVSAASSPAFGNSTVTEGAAAKFRYDYNLVDLIGRLTVPDLLGQPVAFVGDWVHNTAITDDQNSWQAGVEVGKVTERFGSWKTSYYFKRVSPDAVFGGLTDSDFGGGGTNHLGHIMGVQMGLNKYASLGLRYLRTDEIKGSQTKNDTLQADLQTKF